MAIQQLSTIRPDPQDLAAQLEAQLATKASWQDLLTSGVGQTILEFFASVGAYDQFSIERVFKEMFPQTARMDSSIYGITRLLGVRLKRKSPARMSFRIRNATGLAVSIPAYTQMTVNGVSVFNRVTIVIPPNTISDPQYWISDDITDPANSAFIAANNNDAVYLYEGQVRSNTTDTSYTATGRNFQVVFTKENRFVVSDEDVVISVDNVMIPRVTDGLWNYRAPLQAWQDITTSDGGLQAQFGNDLFGTLPQTGSTIDILYVLTRGLLGNDASLSGFTVSFTGQPTTLRIESTTGLVGGSDEISTGLYKNLAPALFAAQERAITRSDYSFTALTYPGYEIIDALFEGQRDLHNTDNEYMNLCRVWVLYNNNPLEAGTPWNAGQFNAFIAFMQKYSMYALRFFYDTGLAAHTDPVETGHTYGAAHPVPITLDVEADVSCQNYADLTEVKLQIEAALDDFLALKRGSISRDVYLSDLINVIKQAHSSIDFVNLKSPVVNVLTNYKSMSVNAVINSTGGLIVAGQYVYYISAVFSNANGLYPNTRETRATRYVYVNILSGTTNTVELSWTPIEGAVSYNIYGYASNGNPGFMFNTTDTSYLITDNIPPGAAPKPLDESGLRYLRKGNYTITTSYTYRSGN